MTEAPAACPLCGHHHIQHFFRDDRDYWQCDQCLLLFVDESQHLTESDEKARYDLHENDIEDAGYCAFLERLLTPLVARLPAGAKGLDFGCGPGPTLSKLLSRKGFEVACYDKYFLPEASRLHVQYDFITATEVLEHVREPYAVLNQLINCLNPHGYLGIMTCLLPKQCDFAGWHYKRDPTHITFYSAETFEWAAAHWNLTLDIPGKDVIILNRGN